MNIKSVFATTALTLAATLVSAQSLFVQKADGTVHEYALDIVKKVSFGESTGKQDIRTITYFANDGTDVSQAVENHVGKPAIVGDGVAFIRNNYLLTSWNTKPDGSGTTYETGESCVYPGSLALYAQWTNSMGKENGHEWVDLGLPSGTKWATMNVGADKPEAFGSYFAWGETQSKTDYSWSTYKYGKAEKALTKYCTDSQYGKDGFTDGRTVLGKEDDAAAANWGGNWRMPTKEEFEELSDEDNCTWQWTTQSGVKGYLVTSNRNGAFIFLPAAGIYYDAEAWNPGEHGAYWTSTLSISDEVVISASLTVNFGEYDTAQLSWDMRVYGCPVRPILSVD